MKVLTIERSKWIRGDAFDTALLNDNGKMCCLGFDAIACGLPAALIDGRGNPDGIDDRALENFPDYLKSRRFIADDFGITRQSAIVDRAIKHNDDNDIDDEAREHLVRNDLIALGWDDVVFVD